MIFFLFSGALLTGFVCSGYHFELSLRVFEISVILVVWKRLMFLLLCFHLVLFETSLSSKVSDTQNGAETTENLYKLNRFILGFPYFCRLGTFILLFVL